MNKVLACLVWLLSCLSLQAAVTLKVGDTHTFSIGYVSHLQNCVWTISHPQNVTFYPSPGALDASVTIKAIKEFSGVPCVVQCSYRYLELDPITGRYIYSRSDYKKWYVFVDASGGGGTDGPDTPVTPSEKKIKLSSFDVTITQGERYELCVNACYGPQIAWKVADENIAQPFPIYQGGKVLLTGWTPGTTYAYATDSGGGTATCKITVLPKEWQNGETIIHYGDHYEDYMKFRVTDAEKRECSYVSITRCYLSDQEDILTIPEQVFGLTVVRADGSQSNVNINTSVKSMIFPKTLREIGEGAFYGYDVEEVELPEGLVSIGDYAFNKTNLKSLHLPSTLESVGYDCFKNCYNLESVAIPANLKSVSTNCFADCTILRDVTLEEGVEELQYGAFDGTSIQHIILPNSMKRVCERSLNTKRLLTITSQSETPCEMENAANTEIVTLFVPQTALQAYQESPGWSRFLQVKAIGETVDPNMLFFATVNRLDKVSSIKGRMFAEPPTGEFTYECSTAGILFEFLEYDGNNFIRYGTSLTGPFFELDELEGTGIVTKQIPLYEITDDGSAHHFEFPTYVPYGKLYVNMDPDKQEVTLRFDINKTANEVIEPIIGSTPVTIYTILGVRVFEGLSSDRYELPSGIYIIRYETGQSEKMIIR